MATAQELQQQQNDLRQQIKDTNAVIDAQRAKADALAAQARLLPEGSIQRADLMSQAGDIVISNTKLNEQNVTNNDQFTSRQQTLDATVNAPFADPADTPAPDPNTGGASDTADSVVDYPNYATGPGGYVEGQAISEGGGYVPGADETAADTAEKYADPNNIGPDFTVKEQAGGYDAAMGDDIYTGGGYDPDQSYTDPNDLSSMPGAIEPAEPVINGTPDTRVKLLVPHSYLSGNTTGPKNQLKLVGGIIFPYTPTISLEHKANYSGVNTPHSNYTQYFYKNSAVSEIGISAKFTVQNEEEAGLYIAVVHLLRVLTKMQFGNDSNAGSPPPICRLLAFGDYMLNNVPVAVTSFKADYPDNVDYFRTGDTVKDFGYTSVPVLSTINLTLIPMYSRAEMLRGTVTGWINGNQRVRGYL
jgi:hypothetical protein